MIHYYIKILLLYLVQLHLLASTFFGCKKKWFSHSHQKSLVQALSKTFFIGLYIMMGLHFAQPSAGFTTTHRKLYDNCGCVMWTFAGGTLLWSWLILNQYQVFRVVQKKIEFVKGDITLHLSRAIKVCF